MSEDIDEPAIDVTNNFIVSENGNGPLTLSKRGKVTQFIVKHDTAIITLGVGAIAFGGGVLLSTLGSRGQLDEWREYVKNLRAELGAAEIDHQTMMDFIEYKKLRPQFDKFIAEQSAA